MTSAQGVQETLKGTGKDAYTLRFATEQLALEWHRGFELIAKVGGVMQLQRLLQARARDLTRRCSTRLLCSRGWKRQRGSCWGSILSLFSQLPTMEWGDACMISISLALPFTKLFSLAPWLLPKLQSMV